MMVEITLKQLAERLGGQLLGDGGRTVRGLDSLTEATGEQVSFLANAKYAEQVKTTEAAAVIVPMDFESSGQTLIRCEDPYFAFREAMVLFYGFRKTPFSGISDRAEIHPSSSLGENVRVAPFATVSSDVVIGPGTVLYPGVFIAPGCRIGENCTLHPNVCLYEKTVLGNRVTIHANTSIGLDGFGYATHSGDDGVMRHEKIPPIGWVELEDDVDIGSGCAIERATMGTTVIGEGTKFADLIGIGHGTKMGKHCLLVSQSGIAGSVHVGNYCVFGGQAGLVGHIRIGDGVRVGAQAGVAGNIEAGQEVLGSPAIPRVEAGRVFMATQRLPQLRKSIKKLIKQVAALENKLDERTNQTPET